MVKTKANRENANRIADEILIDNRNIRKEKIFIFLNFLFAYQSSAYGYDAASNCVMEAATRFGHSTALLHALIETESAGKCPRRHATNTNGSYDIGCMGINSSWLPRLHADFGITEVELYDTCTNINVGAWILARNVRAYGNHWRAVGAYNARSESKRIAYAWKINARLGKRR